MYTLRVFVLCFVVIKYIVCFIHLKEKYSWRRVDFEYPNEYVRQQALNSGAFQPQNLLPYGIARFREKLFITIPRWRDGVPATLSYIDMNKTPYGSPKLIPYPSWAGNRFGDCDNGINYAFRVHVDQCNRLWVYDPGYSGLFTNRTQVCAPSIKIFNLDTNERIRFYELNPKDNRNDTILSNIVVDIVNDCDDAYAYLAEPLAFALVVYSLKDNQSWRFDHAFFYPDPLAADFNIAGLNFQWEIGIHGMTLSEPKPDGYRILYFSPQTSLREFNVSTRILQDKSRVTDSYHDFNVMNERGPNRQVVSRVIDQFSGVMLFTLPQLYAVGCWHTAKPYTPEYHDIVDYDATNLQFLGDLKIDENYGSFWAISNRQPEYFLTNLTSLEINYRILTAPVDQMIKGTRCDPKSVTLNHTPIGYDYPQYRTTIQDSSTKGTDRTFINPNVNNQYLGHGYQSQSSADNVFWSKYPEWFTKSL